jgi:Lrp/AsnC family transcriptional regulator, leucine-responsive regulatory protein
MEMRATLTDVELTVIGQLQRDARQSTADLAQQLNLSTSPTWRKIKRLEESGVIRGYQAVLDPRLLGFEVEAFVLLGLAVHDERSHERIAAAVAGVDEIVSCHRVSGSGDYMLRIMTRDLAGYGCLLTRVIGSIPGISKVETSFVLNEVKARNGLPVELLRDSTGSRRMP